MILFFYALIVFVFMDAAVMRKRDPEKFAEVFNFSAGRQLAWGILFIFGLGLGLFPAPNFNALFGFLTAYVLAVYLTGRRAFRKYLAPLPADGSGAPARLALAAETLTVVLHWLAWMMVFTLVFKVIQRAFALSGSLMLMTALFSIISFLVMFVLIWKMTRRVPGMNFSEVMGARRNGQSVWRIFVLPFLVGTGMALFFGGIMAVRRDIPATPFGQMIEGIDSFGVLMVFLTAAVVLAPFFEEVIFRGFLFYVIERLKNRLAAIVAVTAIFALLHVDQYQGDGLVIITVAILGMILTLFRAWTGSTIPGIVAHYAFNLTMTVVPIILISFSNPVYFEYQVKFFRLDNAAKEQMLKESLRRYPDHAPSYNDLAWVYAEENKNLPEALQMADRALSADPDNHAFADTKAEVLFKLGRVQEAVDIETELLKRNPGHPMLEKQLEKFKAGMEVKAPASVDSADSGRKKQKR